jgi:Family of unknown function (DUF6152)
MCRAVQWIPQPSQSQAPINSFVDKLLLKLKNSPPNWRFPVIVKPSGFSALRVVFLLLVSAPIFAHHGAASYDISKMTTLKGAVTTVQWINPHVEVDMEVTDSTGKAEKYVIESVSPLGLSRNGWTKDSVKPGDQITVTGNLSKNGTHILRLKKIVFSSGKEFTILSGEDYAGQ